jgi:DNA-binding IclR family transcriptional regulator
VLQLLLLLAHSPKGMRAADVAAALDKSVSTAYSLLDTLCQEGFAVHLDGAYHLTSEAYEIAGAPDRVRVPAGLDGVVDELFARTHKRAYLALSRGGTLVIPLVRGRQGMPRIPGLGLRVGENAHALALGKIALSLLSPAELDRYLDRGLRGFTACTITDPDLLRAELEDIRAGAIAADCEELAENFCCLATPVRDLAGRVVAALGISMTAHAFAFERDELERVLTDVAQQASEVLSNGRIPAISEETGVLEDPHRPFLRSGHERRAAVATEERETPA